MGLDLNLIKLDSIWFNLDLIGSSPIGYEITLYLRNQSLVWWGFDSINSLIGLGPNCK